MAVDAAAPPMTETTAPTMKPARRPIRRISIAAGIDVAAVPTTKQVIGSEQVVAREPAGGDGDRGSGAADRLRAGEHDGVALRQPVAVRDRSGRRRHLPEAPNATRSAARRSRRAVPDAPP